MANYKRVLTRPFITCQTILKNTCWMLLPRRSPHPDGVSLWAFNFSTQICFNMVGEVGFEPTPETGLRGYSPMHFHLCVSPKKIAGY
jgi:hypothetical protein